MKKIITLILIAALAASVFGGCGQTHTHTWTEATCTAPRTCASCGATEGTALGHDWADATCTMPRTCRRCHVSEGAAPDHDWREATCTAPVTCARCGKTASEPLGHQPTEADYWSPSVCTVCGEELAPALEPVIPTKYGLTNFLGPEDVCVMETHSWDKERTLTMDVSLSRYEIVPSMEDFPRSDGGVWQLTPRDGYEWRVGTVQLHTDDETLARYGCSIGWIYSDYYSEGDTVEQDVTEDGEVFHDHAFFHGKDYDVKVLTKSDKIVYDRATGASDLWIDFAFQVPVGFDGFFLGVYDSALLEPDQYAMELLTNESPLFRLAEAAE